MCECVCACVSVLVYDRGEEMCELRLKAKGTYHDHEHHEQLRINPSIQHWPRVESTFCSVCVCVCVCVCDDEVSLMGRVGKCR